MLEIINKIFWDVENFVVLETLKILGVVGAILLIVYLIYTIGSISYKKVITGD